MANIWKWLLWLAGALLLWLYFVSVEPLLPAVQAYYNSKQGHCLVLAKRVQYVSGKLQPNDTYDVPSFTWQPDSYIPIFTFIVTTRDGQHVETQGYAPYKANWTKAEAETILRRYEVGNSYGCWYDPDSLSTALLSLEITPIEIGVVIASTCAIGVIALTLTIGLLRRFIRYGRRHRLQQQ